MLEEINHGIAIEPARRDAQEEIRSMVRAGRLNPFGLHWRRFLLATDSGGEIVGCVQVKIHRGGARELASLYVRPELRRRGLGSRLVERALAEQAPPLWLTCRSRLIGFYRRFGFEVVDQAGEMPGYFRLIWSVFVFFRSVTASDAALVVMRWRGDRPS